MQSMADKISEAELEVMRVVWDQGRPVTYAEIRDALSDTGWASDTIHTMVRRLHQKGVLLRNKDSVYRYTAAIGEADFIDAKTKSFVHKVYGGNVKGLLSALLDYDDVGADDLDDLRNYWRKGKTRDE